MSSTAANDSGKRLLVASSAVVRLFGWPVWLAIALVILIPFILAPLMFFFEERQAPSPGQQISDYGKAVIPKQFIPIYMAAAEKYRVPWALLAAHHKVETDFGRDLSTSYTGAVGQMQFEPCTWIGWNYPGCKGTLGGLKGVDLTNIELIKKYGGYGEDADHDFKADPNDPWDAIFAAAHYLADNGAAKGNLKQAIYAYNHDPNYVAMVLKYMNLFVQPDVSQPQIVSGGGMFIYPLPISQRITSGFSLARLHPVLGYVRPHYGVDFGRPPSGESVEGKPVVAAASGKVVFSGVMGGYGNIIIIDHGHGIETRYGHLEKRLVSEGQTVKTGQVIALCGHTGTATGPHLHFEVRINGTPVDPIPYLKGK
jgi:murein DD-endopeptidase MepM/ murein hydrolase activator NlpD